MYSEDRLADGDVKTNESPEPVILIFARSTVLMPSLIDPAARGSDDHVGSAPVIPSNGAEE